jgi:hypothetical protein
MNIAGATLDAISARLVHWFAAGDIATNLAIVEWAKTHFADRQGQFDAIFEADGYCRQNAMRVAGKTLQMRLASSASCGLPISSPASSTVVSAARTGCEKQLSPTDDSAAVFRLVAGDTLDVTRRVLARQRRFVEGGVVAR